MLELFLILALIVGFTLIVTYSLITSAAHDAKRQSRNWPYRFPRKKTCESEPIAQFEESEQATNKADEFIHNNQTIQEEDKGKNLPEWSLKFIQSIEWREFEKFCCRVLKEKGLLVEQCKLGPDGGIDICIYSKDTPSKIIGIGQCKAWRNKVGEITLREFRGVMADRNITKGFFFSSSEYYPKAEQFAKRNEIELITGTGLLKDIKELPKEIQDAILSEILESDYTTPTCPKCGIKMKLRSSKLGKTFWGCPNYAGFPKCTNKIFVKKDKNDWFQALTINKHKSIPKETMKSRNALAPIQPYPPLIKIKAVFLLISTLILLNLLANSKKTIRSSIVTNSTNSTKMNPYTKNQYAKKQKQQPTGLNQTQKNEPKKVAWATGDENIYVLTDSQGKSVYTNQKK